MASAIARSFPAIRSALAFGSTLIDLLYPQYCCGCATMLAPGARAAFCPPCATRVRVLRDPICSTCGHPLLPEHPEPRCLRCTSEPPEFSRARSWAYYSTDSDEKNPVARALWSFKYGRRLDVGCRLARALADQAPYEPAQHHLVLPVPLHKSRLRRRGFNHACILATGVARRIRAPLAPGLLRRIRATPPQVSLPEAARAANVRGAFVAVSPPALAQRRVLLVDDVYTTGATAAECANVLRAAGATEVDVLTLARVVRC